jgi:putative ABC transport system permease protein
MLSGNPAALFPPIFEPMRRFLDITASSLKMALQELWKNKLRTFLSLFGVTIGIFCIIGVLATVNSLETNIQNQLKDLGNNTIYIDKWDWGGGPDYPYWKYAKRPLPRSEEIGEIKRRTASAQYAAFFISGTGVVEAAGNSLNNVRLYGVSADYASIQPLNIRYGRMLTEGELERVTTAVVIGNEVAETLFGEASLALGRELTIRGRRTTVVGVIRKQGSQLVGGWQFDQCILLSYRLMQTFVDERRANGIIMVKGREGISSRVLKDELTGVMRSVRRLSPTQESNFSLNDINDFGETLSETFVSVNIGGWAIGILSFIVGIFGVANIMFVTVKERTTQIGLKKAIGARRSMILSEFLLESAFLCIIGGIIGLLLVFGLTRLISVLFDFPLFLSPSIIALALLICIIAGVLAGIIPALQAARMNPVVAIRSK